MRFDNGGQRRDFRNALLSAFPRRINLEEMFSFEFNIVLNRIATGDSYSEVVFRLIEWAEAQGKLQELIDAASEYNPGNPQLREFCQQWSQSQLPQEPALIIPPQIEDDQPAPKPVPQQPKPKPITSTPIEDNQPAPEPVPQQPKPTPKTPPQIEEDDLRSEKGVDYKRLRDLLKAGRWKEADEETLTVMLKAAGKRQKDYLNSEDIEKFPCTDLRTIDQLWVKYSNGHFGFSVQKRIWESVGQDYEKFGDRVGWRKGMFFNTKEWLNLEEITFSLSAPKGHLPSA